MPQSMRLCDTPLLRLLFISYKKTRRISSARFFVFMDDFGAYAAFFAALRTGVPSSFQMPKPVAAQSREKMGTNQLSRA